jgi:hypothetical protein
MDMQPQDFSKAMENSEIYIDEYGLLRADCHHGSVVLDSIECKNGIAFQRFYLINSYQKKMFAVFDMKHIRF